MHARVPLEAGAESVAGPHRAYQQDRFIAHQPGALYVVFDGHGDSDTGHVVAELCRRRFVPLWERAAGGVRERLEDVVAALEGEAVGETARLRCYAGSTLCGVVVAGRALWCVNVGDSRSVLALWREGGIVHADMSRDHVASCPVERERVERAGGWVDAKGSVNGYITMTRALGDNDLKAHRNVTPFKNAPARIEHPPRFTQELFTAEPDVTETPLRPEHRFVIVASDGLWNSLSSASAVSIVHKALTAGHTANKAAAILVRAALRARSTDNVTALVVIFDRAAVPAYAERRRIRSAFVAAPARLRDLAPAAPPARASAELAARPRAELAARAPPAAAAVTRARGGVRALLSRKGGERGRDRDRDRAVGPLARRRLRRNAARAANGAADDEQTVHGAHAFLSADDEVTVHGAHLFTEDP